MGISELEKVVREKSGEKDLHSIEEATLSPEFTEAARTLGRRKGHKVTAVSLLSPTVGIWI